MRILVSACLVGINCRYNGSSEQFFIPELKELVDKGIAVAVCPEVAGGLPVPREPMELDGKRIPRDRTGRSYLEEVERGNSTILSRYPPGSFQAAVLKENSPSCGCCMIYDGTFTGSRVPGQGLFAELLGNCGINVCSNESISGLRDLLNSLC